MKKPNIISFERASVLRIIFSILKRRTIFRTLYNAKIAEQKITLKGRVLDLASGSNPRPDYVENLVDPSASYYKSDYKSGPRVDFIVDLQKDFPFRSEEWDAVLLFNGLMFIREIHRPIDEVFRVLKQGGMFIGTVNSILWHTPEPDDFWRFGRDGIIDVLQGAGFASIQVIPFGGRFTSAYYLVENFFYFRVLKCLLFLPLLLLDKVADRLLPKHPCPMGYVFICIK